MSWIIQVQGYTFIQHLEIQSLELFGTFKAEIQMAVQSSHFRIAEFVRQIHTCNVGRPWNPPSQFLKVSQELKPSVWV
jgi:hypothetical protein